MYVVGVDGCPGGWVAVRYDLDAPDLSYAVHPSFPELLAAHQDAVAIGVDIPIGLAEGEPRRCDMEARKALGPRGSSVFPAPDPRVITATSFEQALQRARTLTGKGISIQVFGIFPKILEVNWTLTSAQQDRVFEVHPEVSFWALAGGRPMAHAKDKPEGYRERQTLLADALGVVIPDRANAFKLARPASPDDVLDAIVAAWTARRWPEGRAERLPQVPKVDARGLRMEIVY